MEDFNTLVTEEPSWKNTSKEANFQSSAVGMLHRVWFPKVSWNGVKKMYKQETGDEAVSLEWYVKKCLRREDELETTFNLTFSRNLDVWKLTIQDLLFKPLDKLDIYKELNETDCTGIVFPVVGKAVVLIHSNGLSLEGDYLVKGTKDGVLYILTSLETFAKTIDATVFYSNASLLFDF